MSYEKFFGLNDPPFSLTPNPRYLFESVSHAAALEQLARAIDRREPLIVMTGEIGTGKTLLCRTVLQRLDRQTFVSVINNPLLDRDDLLRQMLQDFGVMSTDRTTVPATSRHDLVHALEDFLSSLIVLGAHAVVIIDEAQHVQSDVLEQIRLLSNIDAPSGTMLQIILIGQLDLESILARPELRQFQQRVSRRIRLEPLGQDELRAYIAHRLAIGRAAGSGLPGAGELANALLEWDGSGAGAVFTPDAVQTIWRWSGGLPRVVNLLCDRALEAACAQRLRTIDADLVDAAAMALDLRVKSGGEPAPPVLQHVDSDLTPIPAGLESTWGTARARNKHIAQLIAVLIVSAVAAWFVTRDSARSITGSRVSPAGGPTSSAVLVVVPSTSTTSLEPAAAPHPASPSPASSALASPSAASIGTAPDAIGPSFEIIVASFRTEARAAAVATQVSDAGLEVRRRTIGGWQQVIAGPFTSREAADAAHQRLERAGLLGTQVVSAQR